MNLHQIVSGSINGINPFETVKVYHPGTPTNVKGKIINTYTIKEVRAQIQAPSAADIQMNNQLSSAIHRIKVWLSEPTDTINRFAASTGDLLKRVDGSFWKVVSVSDNFPEWQCVLCILQTEEVSDNDN